jgi:hypothetical protein
MTENNLLSTFPWLHLPDGMKLGLQRHCLEALEFLQNLHAFKYTGSTLSQGSTQALVRPPSSEFSSEDWATAHRSTLENLLQVICEYYRRLQGDTSIKVALFRYCNSTYLTFLCTANASPSRIHMCGRGRVITHST